MKKNVSTPCSCRALATSGIRLFLPSVHFLPAFASAVLSVDCCSCRSLDHSFLVEARYLQFVEAQPFPIYFPIVLT